MKKIEIILSEAIDEDFLRRCHARNLAKFYTKSVDVQGEGNTNPKHGDAVWPQYNVHYMMVIEDEQEEDLKKVVESLRRDFPDDGTACFVTPCYAI